MDARVKPAHDAAYVGCPGRSAARRSSRRGALQNRDRTKRRRLVRSRFCEAALRKSHSASKTRVNALMSLHRTRDTRNKKPRPQGRGSMIASIRLASVALAEQLQQQREQVDEVQIQRQRAGDGRAFG